MSKPDKQQKRDARELREKSRAAFAAGDYLLTQQLDAQIAQSVPDTDLSREAMREARNLKLDPWALGAGGIALGLLTLAWLLSIFAVF